MTLARTVDKLEARQAASSGQDLATALQAARERSWPAKTEADYRALGEEIRGKLGTPEGEQLLVDAMGAASLDPLAFVYLNGWDLRAWQRDLLHSIGDELQDGSLLGFNEAIRRAISSGHGVGKSALIAMLILWAISTFEDARVVLAANTESQLLTKSWPEIQKWHRTSLTAHWFTFAATAIYSKQAGHDKTWRVDAATWSESSPEAFAGLHNAGRRILLVFDEGSAIPDTIYAVGENQLTDDATQMLWIVCGNPTRSMGHFYEAAFGRFQERWHPTIIDRRNVEGVSQAETQALIASYGADSNYVRVRVMGLPPTTDDLAFFSRTEVDAAMARESGQPSRTEPALIGVDVARRGADQSVITFRFGLDARWMPPIKIRGADLMQLAARVALEARQLRAIGYEPLIFCDGTGLGAGLVDRLRQLQLEVIDVQFAAAAPDPEMAANLRAWMHLELRAWLRKGGALPVDDRLKEQMLGIEYAYNQRGAILLEKKDDLKSRLGYSPDELDSLCCTFASPVAPIDERFADLIEADQERERRKVVDYDPYSRSSMNLGHDPYADR